MLCGVLHSMGQKRNPPLLNYNYLLMNSSTMTLQEVGTVSTPYSMQRAYAPVWSALEDNSSCVCKQSRRARVTVLTMCAHMHVLVKRHTREGNSTLSAASSISKALQNMYKQTLVQTSIETYIIISNVVCKYIGSIS